MIKLERKYKQFKAEPKNRVAGKKVKIGQEVKNYLATTQVEIAYKLIIPFVTAYFLLKGAKIAYTTEKLERNLNATFRLNLPKVLSNSRINSQMELLIKKDVDLYCHEGVSKNIRNLRIHLISS